MGMFTSIEVIAPEPVLVPKFMGAYIFGTHICNAECQTGSKGVKEGKTGDQIKFDPDNFVKLRDEANRDAWTD